jgi:hypothetical protein
VLEQAMPPNIAKVQLMRDGRHLPYNIVLTFPETCDCSPGERVLYRFVNYSDMDACIEMLSVVSNQWRKLVEDNKIPTDVSELAKEAELPELVELYADTQALEETTHVSDELKAKADLFTEVVTDLEQLTEHKKLVVEAVDMMNDNLAMLHRHVNHENGVNRKTLSAQNTTWVKEYISATQNNMSELIKLVKRYKLELNNGQEEKNI